MTVGSNFISWTLKRMLEWLPEPNPKLWQVEEIRNIALHPLYYLHWPQKVQFLHQDWIQPTHLALSIPLLACHWPSQTACQRSWQKWKTPSYWKTKKEIKAKPRNECLPKLLFQRVIAFEEEKNLLFTLHRWGNGLQILHNVTYQIHHLELHMHIRISLESHVVNPNTSLPKSTWATTVKKEGSRLSRCYLSKFHFQKQFKFCVVCLIRYLPQLSNL